MEDKNQIIAKLKQHIGQYSPGQRKIAEFVLGNLHTSAFKNGKELAEASGVSEATITRFVSMLGYSGYPAFQKDIQLQIMTEFKGDKRFRRSLPVNEKKHTPLNDFIKQEIENITALQERFDPIAFNEAVQAVRAAKKILIIGVRGSTSLAQRLWFGFNKIRLNPMRMYEISEESFEIVDQLTPDDIIVAIAFPRYLNSMVRLLNNAKSKNIKILSITDSEFSLIQGDVNLYCQAKNTTFISNHCAPMILINALIHETSLCDQEGTLDALEKFESLTERNNFFARPD